jgi:hypothetical protein
MVICLLCLDGFAIHGSLVVFATVEFALILVSVVEPVFAVAAQRVSPAVFAALRAFSFGGAFSQRRIISLSAALLSHSVRPEYERRTASKSVSTSDANSLSVILLPLGTLGTFQKLHNSTHTDRTSSVR